MKRPYSFLFIFFSLLLSSTASLKAQTPTTVNINDSSYRPPITTILLPLFLDSLYKNDQYKFGNTIPRFSLPYLEFYNGVKIAVDSLNKTFAQAIVNVVDTRSSVTPLPQVLLQPLVQQSKLLIGVAQTNAELKTMADFARQQNIPFISATYPNDGGVRSTPQMFVANSTLRTHCMGIYKYLQSNHAIDKLVFITRKGNVEPYLKGWLQEAADKSSSTKLPLSFNTFTDSFSTAQLQSLLDSNRQNVILGASLDNNFAKRLVRSLASLPPSYNTLIIGMPTWDEIDFAKPEFKGMNVMYSTPFVSLSANIDLYNAVASQYANSQNSRPSDMAVKGFEMTYRFVNMLQRWPNLDSFIIHINDKSAKLFCDFDFQPAYTKEDGESIHYFENKHLYFIKKTDGAVKGIY